MWIVAIFCVAGFLLWRSNKRRAQRFVRAVCFLDIVDNGASVDEANGQVARLFNRHSSADADNAAIRYAMDKANRLTDGKQLPWIHDAREKGFAIDSGDSRFDMAHLSHKQPVVSSDQKFSEHFSEDHSYTSADTSFPHAAPMFPKAYHAFLKEVAVNKSKWIASFKAIARAAIRWGLRGAVTGFIVGWFVPVHGLEPWAMPFLVAYVGALAGLAIGLVYSAVRWVYSD